MPAVTESHVEEATLAWLSELGFAIISGPDIGPDGRAPERLAYSDIVLAGRARAAIARLNPQLTEETCETVFQKLILTETPLLIEENRRLHRFLIEGVNIEVARPDGSIGGETVQLIDFDTPENNDWLAVNQFTIIERGIDAKVANRRPDVVLFVNGLPLAVIELKNPGDENATIDGAFNQLQTYKAQIPSLFRTNAVLIISDGLEARIGSLTADRERFMPWRTIEGDDVATRATAELETMLKGVFHKERFLELIRDFIVFGQIKKKNEQVETVKILAGYHQFHAVLHAVSCTVTATRPDGNRKIGVI